MHAATGTERSIPTQADKGASFRALHEQAAAFIIPNPWDIGTARRRDSTVGCDEMMAHVGAIAAATDLPVSADPEDGYGDDPETVAETIRLAAAAGLAGGSIEDVSNRAENPIVYERLRAAAEAARSLPFPFMLTGRAENYLMGRPERHDRATSGLSGRGRGRLVRAGLTSKEDIAAAVRSVDRPVNVVIGLQGV